MNIDELRANIKNRRSNGETYENIADSFGISRALVQYIEEHKNYKPGRNMRIRLELEPLNTHPRTRRAKLDEIAKGWGYKSWCAFETATIREAMNGDQG